MNALIFQRQDQSRLGPPLLSRRRVLQLSTAGGLALMAGCTDTSGVSNDTGQKVSAGDFKIPDAALPDGQVDLRWTDSGDQKAAFFKPFFKAYEKKHENVKITYKGTNWPTIQQSITLGLRNGTAPDVFQLPSTITTAQAVTEEWIGAFDDILPDWAEVKKRFPPGIFANGVTDFDERTYALPITSNVRLNNLMFFNKDFIEKAGYDLSKVITWDEFRTVMKAVTKQGAGDYYGIIMGLAQDGGMSGPASAMAEMAGVHGGIEGFDWTTGDYNFTNPISAEAVELFLALKSDGCITPGSVSLNASGARGRFPQGQAAVIIQGPWNIAAWTQGQPDFKLGLNIPAQRDPKAIWPMVHAPGGSNNYVFAAKPKYPEVIGDIVAYICSEYGQSQWASLNGAADPAAFPDAIKKAELKPLDAKSLEIDEKYMVLRPEPSVRNPDVEKVYQAQKQIQPTFSEVCVGLFTGQIKGGVEKAMKELQDRSNKALDEAIATAKKRGADVSRDDWVFDDWDPKKSYDKLYQK